MAFPATSLIDDFTGSDGSISGRSCSDGIHTWTLESGTLNIASNALTTTQPNVGSAYISGGPYGPNVEAYMTLATPPTPNNYCQIVLRDNYVLWYDGANLQIRVASPFAIISMVGTSLSAGDKIGMNITGNVLTSYKYTSGAWTQVDQVTDNTTSVAGAIKVSVDRTNVGTNVVDDFGGGALGQTLLPDADIAAGLWINELGAASPLYSKLGDYSDSTYMRGTAA